MGEGRVDPHYCRDGESCGGDNGTVSLIFLKIINKDKEMYLSENFFENSLIRLTAGWVFLP